MALSVRATLGWLWQVVVWLVIVAVVVVLAAAVLVPRIAGATPYTVLTGSMRPSYPEGTLVVVKPVEFDEIGLGDVITYQLESGRATVVTHRVVGTANRFDGEQVLVTRGDANEDPDPERVREVQVQGELWYSIPYLGHVNNAITGSQRQTAVLVVSALLVGYAAYMFVGALRDRRRRRTEVILPKDPQIDGPPGTIEMAGTTAPAVPAVRERQDRLGPVVAGVILLAAILLIVRRHRNNHGRATS